MMSNLKTREYRDIQEYNQFVDLNKLIEMPKPRKDVKIGFVEVNKTQINVR